jgi:hypothetical protein
LLQPVLHLAAKIGIGIGQQRTPHQALALRVQRVRVLRSRLLRLWLLLRTAQQQQQGQAAIVLVVMKQRLKVLRGMRVLRLNRS